MPRLKHLAYIFLLIGGLSYAGYKYTPEILAQVSPEFAAQIQAQYDSFLKTNQNLIAQTTATGNYLSSLVTQNQTEITALEKEYNNTSNTVTTQTPSDQIPPMQAVKALQMSIIRYETLNQTIYTTLNRIKSTGTAISESGFATNNIETEIAGLNETISKIEANLSTLNYISDKIKNQTVSVEEGISSASTIIDQMNIDYQSLFGRVKEIVSNAQ